MPNIHPIAVHFPIAFLVGAFVCEVIGRAMNNPTMRKTAKWMLLIGTVALGIAAFTGWLGHKTVPHSESSYALIEQHQKLGFISLGFFVAISTVRFWLKPTFQKSRIVFLGFFTFYLLGLAIMTWGSHLGGRLVYEMGVGVQVVDHDEKANTPELDAEFEKLFFDTHTPKEDDK